MKIPYGISSFEIIRTQGYFYIDKTPFARTLEFPETGLRYTLFLRPRRFGKSTLLNMLEHYYDLLRKDQFEKLFQGLWIHQNPTPERNQYLVLTLDFSKVITDSGLDVLRDSFYRAVRSHAERFLERYKELAPVLARVLDRLLSYLHRQARKPAPGPESAPPR